jgi:hypothetical protein
MAGLEVKSRSAPDESRDMGDAGDVLVYSVGGRTVLSGTWNPGWRWSEHIKPIAGTDSCEATHLVYIESGRMHVVMDDGAEGEAGPGDFVYIAPGHDAWVVGDEPCVGLDFGGFAQYAQAAG